MTNLVFVEHKKVPRSDAKAIKEDLKAYAVSVALKFPTKTISAEDRIKVAQESVRTLLQQFDLSTKNLGTLIHDEVTSNLQKLYFKLRKSPAESKKELLEMIKIVKLLRRTRPRKYRKLFKCLQGQLNERQQTIFNIYLQFKPRRKKVLSYKTVSKLSNIPVGTIKGQMRQVVKTINKLFRQQKIHGR